MMELRRRKICVAVTGALSLQALSLSLFFADILLPMMGITPMAWVVHDLIQLAALTGVVVGTIFGVILFHRSMERTQEAEKKLRLASGAFTELMEERFKEWSLTPAERDVALFAIKGMSTNEIATLRSTSDGTVKAQTAAIYRKAGVSGRPQLLSLFIDDLTASPALPVANVPSRAA